MTKSDVIPSRKALAEATPIPPIRFCEPPKVKVVKDADVQRSLLRGRIFSVSRDFQRMLTMHERACGLYAADAFEEMFAEL